MRALAIVVLTFASASLSVSARAQSVADRATAAARARVEAANTAGRLAEAKSSLETDIGIADKFTAAYFADSEKKLDGPYAGSLIARIEFLDWSKKALADMKALKSLDEAAAADPIHRVIARTHEIEALIEADKICRTSQACLDLRWAKKTEAIACTTIASRKLAAQQMALEKANPSGVVDLRRLHDLGQAIQDMDAQLVTLRANYKAALHRPLPETCSP
jgi:hypothetical protein